jgi:hypothetical protein
MNNYQIVRQAWLALILVVPASSIGMIMVLTIAPGWFGKTFFTLVKLWIVITPILWRLKVEQKSIELPQITKKQII